METADDLSQDLKPAKKKSTWPMALLNIMIGIILALVSIYAWKIPEIRTKEYNSGLQLGLQRGDSVGSAKGMSAGRALERVEQEKLRKAALATARAKQLAARSAARRKRLAAQPKPTQNWHVDHGVIGEPIP